MENGPNKVEESTRNLSDLSDMCKHYGMRDFVKYKEEPNDLDLIRHFTCGIPDSYAEFKKNRDLNAAFVNCKLKSKYCMQKTAHQVRLTLHCTLPIAHCTMHISTCLT